MGKSRHSKYNHRLMDREYSDGNVSKEEHKDKSKERRYERALRTKNIEDLYENETDVEYDRERYYR
jgi:hypothetical protein